MNGSVLSPQPGKSSRTVAMPCAASSCRQRGKVAVTRAAARKAVAKHGQRHIPAAGQAYSCTVA